MQKTLGTFVSILLMSFPAFAGSDVEFLQKAAQGGMLEVKLGQHAVSNAASPDVRAFGKRMVDDHGKANRELAALARKEGIALPDQLDSHHQEMAEELLAMAGPAFDQNYMKSMVEDHEQDVKAFQREAKDGKTDVDRLAAQIVPTLEAHLAMARDIEKRLNATAAK